MKKSLAVCATLLTVSGCLSVPTTPEETRAMLGGQSIEVSRSKQAVMATLASRGNACLNFGQTTSITRIGGTAGQGMNAVLRDTYRTRIGNDSLVLEHYNPNNVGVDGWYPRIVADVTAKGSGSQLTVYASSFDGAFADTIKSWARGNTTPCPKTDF